MWEKFILCALFVSVAKSHDTYIGICPKFKPMSGFDWNRVCNICTFEFFLQ